MRYNAKLKEKDRFNLDMWLDNEPGAGRGLPAEGGVLRHLRPAQGPGRGGLRRLPGDRAGHAEADFKVLLTAMKNWRTEILAYFDHPITNAYTEAVNGVAKVINRSGPGVQLRGAAGALLFSKGVPEQAPPPLAELVLEEVRPAGPDRLEWHRARRAAFAANPDGICQSCGGVFGKELDLHRTLPLVPGEHVKYMLMCKPCHHRFHTAEFKAGHKHTP
jgi:transposase